MISRPQVENNKAKEATKRGGRSTCCRSYVIVHTVQLDILTFDNVVNTITLHMSKPICIVIHSCASIFMK